MIDVGSANENVNTEQAPVFGYDDERVPWPYDAGGG